MNAWAHAMSPDRNTPPHRVVDPDATDGERSYAVVTHLSVLAMQATGVPFLGPILWLIRRKESPFLDDHGKEAVNFQISILIYFLLSLVLMPVCGIGLVTIGGAYILAVVGSIFAAVAAHRGEFYRYPMTIRLIG